ncbi:MAG: lysophospholipase [Candidatus Thiodiazotropha lotti]|nr:lysophospholipase [Candidatus Thiodiazotropha lotti]
MAKVIVHLVHGTWPYGPLRKHPVENRSQTWFEDGSAFRANLEQFSSRPIHYKVFRWSGKNSFSAREKASRKFHEHLEKAKEEFPDSRHIVIAHSHGGTVAGLSFTGVYDHRYARKIDAFVSMATPFTYISTENTDPLSTSFAFAITYLAFACSTFYWMLTDRGFSETNASYLFIGIIATILIVPAVLHGVFSSYIFAPGKYRQYKTMDPRIPFFVLRGTRDEASLLIGFTQFLNAVFESVFRSLDQTESKNNGIALLPLFFFSLSIAIVAGYFIMTWAFSTLSSSFRIDLMLMMAYIVGNAFFALLFFAGYAALAISVGLHEFWLWPNSRIDVDTVPPDMQVALKTYTDMARKEGGALRHGVYDLIESQLDIAFIIRHVSDGMAPRLMTEEELEDRLSEDDLWSL